MRDRDGGRDRDRPPPQRPADRAERADRARPSDQRPRIDRVRDEAQIRARADRLRTTENEHPEWGHTFREHVWPKDEVLKERVQSGINARGERRDPPVHATRWQSDAAMVIAADGLKSTDEFSRRKHEAQKRGQGQITMRRPLSEVLGPGWQNDVYGRSFESDGMKPSRWRSDSQACGKWRLQEDGRWHLYTCYPEPENHHPAGP